jgi:hypothetical protein
MSKDKFLSACKSGFGFVSSHPTARTVLFFVTARPPVEHGFSPSLAHQLIFPLLCRFS